MKSIRSHLSYANVMATVAVFFAIGGGAVVAAGGGVTSDELGKVTLRTSQVNNISDDGSTNGGSVGVGEATAKCKNGEQLLGGGAEWVSGDTDNNENLSISESYAKGETWRAKGVVDFGAQGSAGLQAQAICLAK